ncbi:uncharacterized protein LOC110981795 isoform X1 [Acanthaster planci]|uniref:Uncharacterized protein LOC110981795 isoform X1 n=1 Tax=Acanthaster planci TaxID=133434 RepID=A0A8B7YSG1_ACAPL|nr:uncharacterized protein LOC110981795 isoform X1 [Acanthaster planci]
MWYESAEINMQPHHQKDELYEGLGQSDFLIKKEEENYPINVEKKSSPQTVDNRGGKTTAFKEYLEDDFLWASSHSFQLPLTFPKRGEHVVAFQEYIQANRAESISWTDTNPQFQPTEHRKRKAGSSFPDDQNNEQPLENKKKKQRYHLVLDAETPTNPNEQMVENFPCEPPGATGIYKPITAYGTTYPCNPPTPDPWQV